jgi:hypothetical protein
MWSQSYKREVLAQSGGTAGELKHVEWDGWGFSGAGDTTVYLVYDPTDSLSAAAKSHQPGKFADHRATQSTAITRRSILPPLL